MPRFSVQAVAGLALLAAGGVLLARESASLDRHEDPIIVPAPVYVQPLLPEWLRKLAQNSSDDPQPVVPQAPPPLQVWRPHPVTPLVPALDPGFHVLLNYSSDSCEGWFEVRAPELLCADKAQTGWAEPELENFVRRHHGPNSYQFTVEGPELIVAGHEFVGEPCVTRHPFRLGSPGTYSATGVLVHTDFVDFRSPLRSSRNPANRTVIRRSLECNHSGDTKEVERQPCKETNSMGRWVVMEDGTLQWKGWACDPLLLNPLDLEGRSIAYYGDRHHRYLFVHTLTAIRDALNPSLELPPAIFKLDFLERSMVQHRHVGTLTVVIPSAASNKTSRSTYVLDPAGLTLFDGYYKALKDEDTKDLLELVNHYSSSGVVPVGNSRGALGNLRWDHKKGWQHTPFPPVHVYSALVAGPTAWLLEKVPFSVYARHIRLLSEVFSRRGDQSDTVFVWTLGPAVALGPLQGQPPAARTPQQRLLPQPPYQLTSARVRLANQYCRLLLEDMMTAMVDLYAFTEAMPSPGVDSLTHPISRAIARHVLARIADEIKAPKAEAWQPAPVVAGGEDPLPFLPAGAHQAVAPRVVPPPAPPELQDLDSQAVEWEVSPLSPARGRPSLRKYWRHFNTNSSEQAMLRQAIRKVTVKPGAQEGFHVIMLWEGRNFHSTYICILALDGTLLATKRVANRLWVAEFMNSSTLYTMYSMGDTDTDINRNNGVFIWNIETDTEQRIHLRGAHHMIEYNPLHRTWLTLQQSRGRVFRNGAFEFVQLDDIWEFDMRGNPVWKWYARAHIGRYTSLPQNRNNINNFKDYTHGNTLHYDVHEGVIYYNTRHLDTFYRINRTSGAVDWGAGRYGDIPQFDIRGQPVRQLFSHSHGLTRIGKDRFITFDNDASMTLSFLSTCRNSRLQEIFVDTQKQPPVARAVWEYVAPRSLCRAVQGGVVKLPNGNRLGAFGSGTELEVTENGTVVWSAQVIGSLTRLPTFPLPHDFNIGSRWLYRPYLEIRKVECRARIRIAVWNAFRLEARSRGVVTVFDTAPIQNRGRTDAKMLLRRGFWFRPHWFETLLEFSVDAPTPAVHVVVENEDGVWSKAITVPMPDCK